MIHKLFTWPLKSIVTLAEKIQEEADKELYDMQIIQTRLVELYTLHDEGAISDEDFEIQEEHLMERYKTARLRQTNSDGDGNDGQHGGWG